VQGAASRILKTEQREAWDAKAKSAASAAELEASRIIGKIREHARIDSELFGNLPGAAVPDRHARDMGGRFLVNLERIKKSDIFRIAGQMPKGAHQHFHFNSEIPPELLFPHASGPEMQETIARSC